MEAWSERERERERRLGIQSNEVDDWENLLDWLFVEGYRML